MSCALAAWATPPSVSGSPTSTTKLLGTSASFSVRAGGGTAPLTYQWSFNDSEIDGATGSVFTIASVKAEDEGSYSARISNSEGDAYSDYAQLTVVIPPTIVTQPEANPDPIYDGDSYTFSVEAQGTDPLSYQWRLNGLNIVGETDSSLLATKAGVYTVRVSNSLSGVGGSTTSSNANLVVWFRPQITSGPTDRSCLAGKSTTFTVAVGSTATKPINYQWLFNDIEIPGATNVSYTIPSVQSTDAGSYSVHVFNVADEVYSDYATLDVLVQATITKAPVSQTVNEGDDVIFDVDIRDDATFPVDYQWRFKGVNIDDGGTSEFLYIPNVDISNAGYYSVVISNAAGVVTSTNVNLVVRMAPDITTDPKGGKVGLGTNFTFSVKATGTAPFSYQWLLEDAVISGATNSAYTFKPKTTNQAGLYSVYVSNMVGVATSAPAVLTVIGETTLPKITITSPLAAYMSVTNSNLLFAGKASDNVIVSSVLFQQNSNPYQQADGLTTWNTPITLIVGTNILHAKAIDSSGNSSLVATRTVFYSVKSPLTLIINGPGTITGLTSGIREVNRGYTVIAHPGAGQAFAGWTGSLTNSNPTLNFMMQTNMVLQANFVPDPFIAHKGVFNGLFYQTNGVRLVSSGAFTLTLREKGLFSGKISMNGLSYPFSSWSDITGAAHFQVTRAGTTPITLDLNLDLTNNTDEINGTVTEHSWNAKLQGDRNIFSRINPSPFVGSYTVAMPGSTTTDMPRGDSIGVATLDALGNVRLAGTMSDGTIISQATTISKTGDWPLYAPLYVRKGSVVSWVTLADTNQLDGAVSWIRPPLTTSKLYLRGFTNLTVMTGGVFKKPAVGTRSLNFTNGVVILSGGNLPTPLTNNVVLNANNTLTISSTNRLALVLAVNGQISGSFIHPITKKAALIKGVVVRQQNEGHGYFLGTNQCGVFLLQGN